MELDYYTCNLSIFRRPETVAHLFLIICHLLLDLLCHYGKQVLRREQKALARACPRALGEELFTESKKENSRRRQKLSVKSSSPRANRLALGEGFLRREFFLLSAKKFLKNHFFTFKLFLPSTCTYKKDMFTFEAIVFMFAILKKFTSFQVIFQRLRYEL
jgi:hypothetical protein